MSLDLYLAFVAACAILIAIPGPDVALIVVNSVAHGTRFGLLTVAGASSAVVVHLVLTVLGATALLNVLAASFEWLRWLLATVLDGVWAILAGRLRALLTSHALMRNRLTGGLLVGAGLGLALARRP